jgi:hypothetical protein
MLACGFVSANAFAQQPARFDFVFEDPASSARAAGYIVFDLDLLPNPGSYGGVNLPHPMVLGLRVTVTGSAQGNGTFTMADFPSITWDTGGLPLDLSPGVQVVGQPVLGGTWAPQSCPQYDPIVPGGGCGNFNLYDERGGIIEPWAQGGSGPNGDDRFILESRDGSGELMELTSFVRGTPESVSVPALSPASWLLMATLLLGIAWVTQRTRS